MLRRLGASPTRTGIGFGLVAGFLLFGASWLRAANILGSEPAVGLGILAGLALLAGLAVPGWRGWRGFSIGLAVTAIVTGVTNALLQPHDVYANGPFLITTVAIYAAAWTIVASAGFAIAVVVRRLR